MKNHRWHWPRLAVSAMATMGVVGCSSSPAVVSIPTAAVNHDAGPPAAASSSSAPPIAPSSAEGRAEALLRQMTLEEKIDYIGGDRDFFVRAIPRLGIPEIKMSDGPVGCRNWGPSTGYPAGAAVAASFDPALAERVGKAMGRDCRARGVHVLLAPGVNLHRSPLGGRNFEYLSGEDPYLAGKTAAAFIRGVQGEGVLATVKHFAGNDQEWDRNHISSEIDERTLREIYLPAFERAVHEGHVGSVMTAYNLLNGTYCSHNEWLIRTVLKQQWGFPGFVMSDWKAVHDPVAAYNGGCDLEMPSAVNMNRSALLPLLNEHKLEVATLDDKVRRILRTVIGAGFLDRPQQRDDIPKDDPTSAAVALEAARSSIVLLKNSAALLPLDRTKLHRIAVIGPNIDPAVVGGSGSAYVTPVHAVSVLAGIQQAAGAIDVVHHPGVSQTSEGGSLGQACFAGPVQEEIFAGEELAGKPVKTATVDRIDFVPGDGESPAPGLGSEHYSIRWTGSVSVPKAGRYHLVASTDDGVRLFLDGKKVVDDWTGHAPKTQGVTVDLKPGKHAVVMEYFQGTLGAVAQFGFAPETHGTTFEGGEAVTAMARAADVVIVNVGYGQTTSTNSMRTSFKAFWPPEWARKAGLVESEDSDRPFELPAAQVETIRLAAAANPRTIVLVDAGGGVDLQKFIGQVPALLWAWYPGQEGGRAVADVLFGEVNPSGKLPSTFAKRYEDYPSSPYYHLRENNKTPYTEGVFVGYRGFDAKQIEPAFPFGHGLSYTTFEYAGLTAEPSADGTASVRLKVTNTGKRAGDEIVQIYVSPTKSSVPRPVKELKGYARVTLAPGESKEVALTLEPRAFAFWDDRQKQWSVEAGAFEILAAASSRDVRLRQTINVAGRMLPP